MTEDPNKAARFSMPGVVTPKGRVVPSGIAERQGYNEAFKQAHAQPDTDTEVGAMHHTLGNGPNQAASGKDTYDRLNLGFLWVQRPAAQTLNNNVLTDIIFTTEVVDTDGMSDLAHNSTDFTVVKDGYYLSTLKAVFVSNATGIRQMFVNVNGGNALTYQINGNVSGTLFLPLCDMFKLVKDDVIKIKMLQNSGAALDVSGVSFTLTKLRDI